MLDVPYFQPGTAPGAERVPALLLVALPLHDAGRPVSTPAAPVRAFLVENLRESEGRLTDEDATRALLAAVDGTEVALVDPSDAPALAAVPVGLLRDDERYAPRA